MKSIFKSKTFWIACVQGILGVVTAISLQHPEIGGLLVAKSVLDVIIRLSTTTEIGKPLE